MTSPYVPTTEAQRAKLLEAIGAKSIEELFADIPQQLRSPELGLPPPLTEVELRRELAQLARRNVSAEEYACFLGGGAARHFVPAAVRALVSRGEFVTPYTPYQAEASQGTLQATYEFQSFVAQLTGMEVANAGMYDGATALAEAILMAERVTGRRRVAVISTVSPRYRAVLETYLAGLMSPVELVEPEGPEVREDCACLVAQYPNFFGYIEEFGRYAEAAHRVGALLIVAVDPVALGLFRPPGDYGADIVVGEGQPAGNPLNFGGPYVGLFATRERFVRQIPGRLVARTIDSEGREGFVLTLQTREQHIRRERATSNITTAVALVALASTVYWALLGKAGVREVAEQCYHKAHYAAEQIARLPGYALPFRGTFFKEFVVTCPRPPAETIRGLLERRILGGVDVGQWVPNGLLLCVTEMNTREEIDRLVQALAEIGGKTA